MTISILEMVTQLKETLSAFPKRAGDEIKVEIWTVDGVNVAENASGAKLVLPVRVDKKKAMAEANGTEKESKSGKDRSNRWANRG